MSRITNVLIATALATVAAGSALADHKGKPHGGGSGDSATPGNLDCASGKIGTEFVQ